MGLYCPIVSINWIHSRGEKTGAKISFEAEISGDDCLKLEGEKDPINGIRVLLGMPVSTTAKKVIFNAPATIVYWTDGTKTVVKCQEGDTFSYDAGIALCFMKKMLGNKGNYNKVLREALEKAQRQGE